MILAEYGINWIWFYDTNKMIAWREHKDSIKTKHDEVIAYWGDEKGRKGIDIQHYQETGEKISYPKNTIQTTNGITLSYEYNDFTNRKTMGE